MAKIRDAWVYKQVRERVREFTEYKQSSIFVGTWNVNAKGKEESLHEWICGDWHRHNLQPDIVAVGFQEIVDLNAVNVAVGNKTEQRTQYWSDQLLQTLNPSHNQQGQPQEPQYALVMQRSLVGLLVCLFVKVQHRQRCKAVASDSVGVGVMGMMGNKGGVSVRLQFYDSTICFVCCHLAAHRENIAGRNADYLNVYQKTSFEIGEDIVRETIRNGSMSQWALGSASVSIADHDVIFWLGDLNYRIDESMPTEKVLELAVSNRLDPLRPLDQLNIERREGRSFQGFEEGALNFVPTYKYQPGTDIYEQRPEKKLRAPAWCDRILWMAQSDPQHVQQLTYNRSETPNCSDHKPVYSTMRVTVKDVILERREAIYKELLSLLDRFENQSLPMVGLDTVELDFGPVRYDQSVTLPIQVTNTGNVCAQFRFVPKLDENYLCKSWMTVTPTYGMLIPGEAAAIINVTVTIDNKTAQLLNGGREVVDDILILRLENGRDYYITVKGTYARSCFGMSLDELVLYKDPIRTIPLDAIERAVHFPNESEISPSNALCIPKELWRIVDAIYEKGLQNHELFSAPGNPVEVSQIREALDTGSPFTSPSSAHSYVECFTKFLRSLSTPVIPSNLFPIVEINSENIQSMSRKFLEVLSPVHYNVLVYIMSFFREVLLYKESNGLTAAKVARICCTCCSPSPANVIMESSMVQRRAGMHLILLHLLETNSI
ncbi:DNase I-like protein [Fragilariopsis cylindrus CCMP1102]|uniref:DNase I-like protein n=1 Tax=Fragilariopsis cylindrus CCMP1102 TaxID=635003 RepID=A0A1E7EW08_9STRA|nr:DNase I-like protein [Fragilariopsis cylindrus CCMP1102]|eukprot:OEU10210.1 DNase I-like protein [Fragilariopsis cylindrus CCMP1102]